jgi:hypothetical protein
MLFKFLKIRYILNQIKQLSAKDPGLFFEIGWSLNVGYFIFGWD